MGNDEGPERFLPLPSATLHILVALLNGEKHGYAIMGDVERLSDGAVRMGPGTLYGAISRQPGSDHHVPDLPHLAQRLATALGADRFRECDSVGSVMDLNDAARYARGQIQLARAALQRGSGRAERPGGLSRREVEVLCLAAKGLTTQDIATQLFISPKTADRHIQNVYTKIGVSNRVGAALWAVQHGVID